MSSERLEACPVCKKAHFVLEELSPVDGEAFNRWRVNCYGCYIGTYPVRTKEQALGIHDTFMQNLATLQTNK